MTGPKVVVAVVVIVVVAAVDDGDVRIVSSSSAEIRLNAEERREFVSVRSVNVSESSFLVEESSDLRAESSVKFTITTFPPRGGWIKRVLFVDLMTPMKAPPWEVSLKEEVEHTQESNTHRLISTFSCDDIRF